MFRCGCVFCEIDTASLKLGVGRSLSGVGALSATNAPMLLRPAPMEHVARSHLNERDGPFSAPLIASYCGERLQ
jgi:hypothetical protein